MILVDIGNTSLHFGVEKDGSIIEDFRVYKKDFNRKNLRNILSRYPGQDIIVCSVAPSVLGYFRKLKRKVYIIGEDIKIPIKSYYNKDEIGQDRLINAFAANSIYPRAKIIVDFGTAITIDILSKKGSYLGGLILPGINLYLNSLSQCELLPDKLIYKNKYSFIPKNTRESIFAGIGESFPIMINSLVHKYIKTLGKKQHSKIRVIVTGGESPLLIRKLDFPYIYDPLLTLKGVLFLKKQF